MSDHEEKKVIVKVAYNYFQDGKWDLALAEYEKLALIDPMDFLVHNMMAEIHLRKGFPDKAVDEYLKAAALLSATNNVEKAIHAYKQVLKQNPDNSEAREKIEELVEIRLNSIDSLIKEGKLEEAASHCEKLSFKVPEMEKVDKKLEMIEEMIKNGVPAGSVMLNDSDKRNEQQTNDELINNLVAMAERYESNRQWTEAIEPYMTVLRINPDDLKIKNKLNELYRKMSQSETVVPVFSGDGLGQETGADEKAVTGNDDVSMITRADAVNSAPEIPKTDLGSAYADMERLRQQAEERLRKSVEDRRERERQHSGDQEQYKETVPVQDSVDEEKQKDMQVFMTQVQIYINQNMFVEALRVCQRILDIDPDNKDVREMLKKIYDKKKIT